MMMRATRRMAKPGEVLFFYGRLRDDNPDHIGMWGGEGATKRHSNAVMYGMTGPRIEADATGGRGWKFGNSFLADLDAAGFDTKTIEFSIRIKKPAEPIIDQSADNETADGELDAR